MHRYRIMVTEIADVTRDGDSLVFEISNHDDLIFIINTLRAKRILDVERAAALALGLKFLSEVTLQERTKPLYEPLVGPLNAFTRELKRIPIPTAMSVQDAPRDLSGVCPCKQTD